MQYTLVIPYNIVIGLIRTVVRGTDTLTIVHGYYYFDDSKYFQLIY